MAEKFKIQRVEDDIEKANEEKVAETGLLPSHDTDQPIFALLCIGEIQ